MKPALLFFFATSLLPAGAFAQSGDEPVPPSLDDAATLEAALAASRLRPSLGTTLPVAAVMGAVAGFGGYLAAFVWELPVGASQTAVALLLFAGAAALGRLLRR